MELKVWVEGIQRIVCGVTNTTTCQDIVFALAHATGKVGRFTLIERWRNNERLLAPNEKPLKLLLKWGEYANNVQFILLRSDAKSYHSNHNQMQLQQDSSQPVKEQQLVNFPNAINANSNQNNNSNENTTVITNKIPLATNNIINSCSTNSTCNYNDIHKNSDNDNINNHHGNTKNKSSNNENDNENALNYPPHSKVPSSLEVRLNVAHERAQQLKKSFSSHDVKLLENVGVVKGVQQSNANNHSNRNHKQISPNVDRTIEQPSYNPQHKAQHSYQQRREQSFIMDTTPLIHHEKSHSNPIEMSTATSSRGEEQTPAFHQSDRTQLADVHQRIANNDSSSSNAYHRLGLRNSKSINAINLVDGRSAFDSDKSDLATTVADSIDNTLSCSSNATIITTTPATANDSTMGNGNLLEIFNDNLQSVNLNSSTNSNKFPSYQQAPAISANGALVPPPYRDPPPPHNPTSSSSVTAVDPIPLLSTTSTSNNAYAHKESIYNVVDYDRLNDNFVPASMDESKSIFQATQYNDLLQLIKYQREKITTQQLELTKFDAEIVYFEKKEHEQVQELETISRDITLMDQILRQGSEQLQTLQYVEDENELVKQQEKTLKSEIALLRSKLANCETELLQCKNKIRLLMDDVEMEQRSLNSKSESKRQNAERDFLIEMESIQNEIDQAIQNADATNKTAENLKKEIQMIENAIADKKRQVEQLVNEMKEVNLQSLAVTTSEEIKHLLEGSNKAGSSRRIIGSPRQLENAVPTSKNPHGVWV